MKILSAAAVLTPREIHICPLDTVRFSCVINREQNTNLILWRIDFMHQSVTPIQETFIADTDRPGLNRTQTNNVQQSVAFMLISTFPYLNSTMHMTATIKDSSQFSQILITCNNVSEPASTLDMSTIYVIPQAPTLDPNVTLSAEDYQENVAIVRTVWNQSVFTDHYLVYLSSINESSETKTYTNSIRLLLSYNTEYNVTIVANNCRGKSNPINIVFFTVGHCTPPVVSPNVIVESCDNGREGSQISYHCRSELEPSESFVSTCIRGGIWSPNPAKHVCKEPSCGVPMVQRNVIIEPKINFTTGSVVSYFCDENSSRTDVATSVCTEERKWMPDPNEYTCENVEGFLILFPLIPVVVASAVTSVMLVLVSFIIITLVCTRKFRRKDVQVINSREAVYDEVHDQRVQQDQPDHKVVLKENAAYGQLTML